MIETILGIRTEVYRKSCLMMAIRSARYLTGRDIDTGKAKDLLEMESKVLMRDCDIEHCLVNEHFFAGITMYLIVIDCIGCIFNNSEKSSEKNSGIGRALESFSSLDSDRINAIINLRNTLAHNFGLATEVKKSNGQTKELKHKYTLSFSDDTGAIELPNSEWDGDYSKKDEDCSTIIGVSSLCNLVEDIISNVHKCYDSGNLVLRISDDEAKARFTVLPE